MNTAVIETTVSPEVIALSKSIKKAWLDFINIPGVQVTSGHHAVYAILRGKSLDKTFTSRKHSLNGQPVDHCRMEAEAAARSLSVSALAPFSVLLEGCEVKSWKYLPSATHPVLSRLSN